MDQAMERWLATPNTTPFFPERSIGDMDDVAFLLFFRGFGDSDISAITAVVTIPLREYIGREFALVGKSLSPC